jgi:hypothetical protein
MLLEVCIVSALLIRGDLLELDEFGFSSDVYKLVLRCFFPQSLALTFPISSKLIVLQNMHAVAPSPHLTAAVPST